MLFLYVACLGRFAEKSAKTVMFGGDTTHRNITSIRSVFFLILAILLKQNFVLRYKISICIFAGGSKYGVGKLRAFAPVTDRGDPR